jgi:hypothetical protein
MTVQVELTEDEAWALAEFLKRVDLSTYRARAKDGEEADLMMSAGEKIRKALADEGYAPR